MTELFGVISHADGRGDSMAQPFHLFLFSAGITLVAVNAFLSIGPAVDDAFIVYRYVRRFLNGQGLTFNDHEYVEGYTSLVWTLLLSLATYLTALKPHVVSVVLNYLAVILTAVAMSRLLRILDVPKAWTYVALALMACSFLYFRVSFIGLESGIFSFLLVLFFSALFSALHRIPEASRVAFVTAGVLGGALFGTRPETILLLPLVSIVLWVYRRETRLRTHLVYLITPWCVAIGAILLWRLAYYGEWLPNSVIAKSQLLSSAHSISRVWPEMLKGSNYLLQAYMQNPGLALIAGLFLFRFCLGPARQLEAVLLFVPIVLEHAAVMQNGGDWMPYFRFVNVFTPIYLTGLFVLIKDWLRQGARAGLVCLSIFAVLHVLANARHFEPRILPAIGSFGHWFDLYQQAGDALKPVWVNGDILMAEGIGILGYTAPNIYIHDPMGLTDRNLAHDKTAKSNMYGRLNWKYSLNLNPALIVLHYWPHQRTWNTFTSGYPENYSFYYIPWLANDPTQCLYVIVRSDRAELYARALQPLNPRKANYEEIVFPCPYSSRGGRPR